MLGPSCAFSAVHGRRETVGVARGSQEPKRPGPRPNPRQGRRGVAAAAERQRSSQQPPGPDAQSLWRLAFLLVRGVRGRAGAGVGARGCAGTASVGDGRRAPPPPPPPPPPSPSGAQATRPKVSEPRFCALAHPSPAGSRSAALVVRRSTLADWLLAGGQPGEGGSAPGYGWVRPEQRLPRGTCAVAPRWVARAGGRTSVVGDRASRASAHYSLEHRSRERLLRQAPCREGPLLAGQQEAGLHAVRQAGRQAGRCGPAKVPRRKSTEGTHHRPARRCGCGGNGMGRRAVGAGGKDRMLERGRAAGGGSGRKAVRASPLFTRPKSEGGPGVEGFPHAAVLRVAVGAGWSVGVGVGGRDEGRQAGRQAGRKSTSSSSRKQVREDGLRRTEGFSAVGAGRRGLRSWRGGRLSGKPVAGGFLVRRFCQARGRG